MAGELPKLVKFIKQKWDDDQGKARSRQEDWLNNIAFYLGYQWQSWDSSTYSYVNPPIEDETGLILVEENLIKPLVDTRVAKILANRPVMNVISIEKDSLSVERADNETKILQAIWYDLNMQTLLIQLAKWSVINNHGFLRPYWDGKWGRDIKNPMYEDELATPDEPEYFKEGRLAVEFLNCFKVLFDTQQPTWNDVRTKGWVSIKSLKSRSDLIRCLPEKKDVIEQLKGSEAVTIGDTEEQVLRTEDAPSYDSRKSDRNMDEKNPYVEVYELYLAPNNEYADGLYGVISEDKELYEGDLPKGLKKIPVFMASDQPGMTTLWGKSLVSLSRKPQKLYNLTLSKIVTLGMIPPLILKPRGASWEEGSLTDRGYMITDYDLDEGLPSIVTPPQIPDQWLYVKSGIQAYVEHLWGMHEVSMRGQSPGNNRLSGRGIFLLQEGDMSRLVPTMTMWDDTLSDLGECLLDLARANMLETRNMYYPVEGGKYEPIEFNKDSIRDKLKVKIEVGSEFQRNKQAMQQFVIQVLTAMPKLPAILETLNDPVVFHKLMSFVSEEFANVFIYKNQNMATAERENRALLIDNEIKPVQSWHKHMAHINAHRGMMNSIEWESLPEELRKKFIEEHFGLHSMAMAQTMLGQLNQQPTKKPGEEKKPGATPQAPGGGSPPATTNPLNAIDQVVEDKVQPPGSVLGQEQAPGGGV